MSKKKPTDIEIDQPEPPVPTKILAESIIAIAEGFRKLQSQGMNRRALIVLLKDATLLGKTEIERVLNSLEELDGLFVQKRSKK